MRNKNLKKMLILNLPYILIGAFATNLGEAWRLAEGANLFEKIQGMVLGGGFSAAFANPLPSLYLADLLIGIIVGAILRLAVYLKGKNAKKYRHNVEYGSARWGTQADIEPFVDAAFENNLLLSQSERITMNSRPAEPKYARNKNVLVVGGSGSGKTRFFIKPNLLQMHSSYCVTDPKGTIVNEVGNALLKNGYEIKIFNTINFKKSMHYNPFAYVHSEKDILKLVTTLIANTKGEGKGGDEFWEKAEKLLYSALIGYIHYEAPEEEQNFSTLLELINAMEVREDDEEFKNPVDLMFDELAERDPDHFAVRQYLKFKLAAGKTSKSILVSCGARLAPFDIKELREITAYDELELDMLGDRKTALFLIMSDTDATFNFLISMVYTQLFNLLCEKADDVYGGRLPIHVRCLIDEMANIGQIPNLEKLMATIRSREISAALVLQAKSQLKAIYKDNADTIMDAPVKDRNTKEVEAESIAYTVCQHFGIDTSDYSFGYIAGWSSGREMTELKASLDTIRRTASELITGIEGQLQALQLERAMEQAQEKESLLLVQTTDLSEYSLLNVRGMDAQELVAALADMSEDDKLSVQAYLESKGAWTTEIANQDTKEFEEYHFDVRYFTDRGEIVDVSKAREQQAEENLSVMGKAEAMIGELEANEMLFTQEERNLIVNYAYKTDDFDKTKALAQKLALMEDKGLAGAGAVMAEAQAEIDELPDPMIGLYEMHDYGYDWSEMLPLTKERALELWDDDYPIYLLHVDGSETMADDREEIEEHGGIFGIEKEDWMREHSLDRENDMEQENEAAQPVAEETVSEEKTQDTYKIYQLKSDDELWQYHFENLESLKAHDLKVEGKNYELKYEGEWIEGMHLEGIYAKFNIDRPEDFTGHSLSVGDIVVLNRDGKETAHFVDSVGFVEVPEFFLENVQEQTREEVAESIEDGDEIIDLGDDREAVLAQIRGNKEVDVQDTSGQDVQKQKSEVEITLTVAECGEFHNMGEFYENIPTVEEAIALFEKIPPERMNGIPAIGINLHRAGEDVENDIAIDIAGTKSIDLDVLQYVPDIANEPRTMEVVAELIAKLPDREIDGNLSPELEAKVWEKRMPQLSEEEKLAVEFDRLCFEYDRILYHDTVRNMSENVEELSQEIKKEGTGRISDILREIVTEGVVPEEVERAKELLDKLSEYKPLAKVEEVEEQNYNMIDNVLNNGAEKAKKEADRKEMDEPRGRVSLKERLAEKKAIIAGSDKAVEAQENVKKNQREM